MEKSKYQKPQMSVTECFAEHSIAAGSVRMEFDTEFEGQVDIVDYDKESIDKDIWF